MSSESIMGDGLSFPEPKVVIDPVLLAAMKAVAAGRRDNGRPHAGEMARQIMREALTQCGINW